MTNHVLVIIHNRQCYKYELENVSNKTVNELANEIYAIGNFLPEDVVTITIMVKQHSLE